MHASEACIAAGAGFTLSELLVALTIALVVSAGVVKLADEARTFFLVQPEVMDVTQRARVGVDLLTEELTSAGAGASLGADAGPLIRWIPPIVPARYQGSGASDPAGQVFSGSMTIVTAAETSRSSRCAARWPARGGGADCRGGGLSYGRRRVWLPRRPAHRGVRSHGRLRPRDGARNSRAAWAAIWIGGVVSRSSALAKAFREEDDARVVQVRAVTYYHDAARNQLRRATGPRADAPVLDDVVGLSFRYFGDRAPPSSPRPPPGAANCLFDVAGVPALGALAPDDGDQVELTEAMLTDGPWCGGAGSRGRHGVRRGPLQGAADSRHAAGAGESRVGARTGSESVSASGDGNWRRGSSCPITSSRSTCRRETSDGEG